MEEWIRKYEDGYRLLDDLTSELSVEELTFKPSVDQWSIREVLIHLADAELFWVQRMKKILAEENPLLLAYDQDLWSQRMAYNELDEKQFLEVFRSLRISFMAVIRRVQMEDWERTGVHNVAGKLTLREVFTSCVEHVDEHLLQIERVKLAYRSTI